MEIKNARALARDLMDFHGLGSWTLRFTDAKRRAGYCNATKKEIGLSSGIVRLNGFDRVKNTILHEIAHALCYQKGLNCGHNDQWRRVAISIGCDGRRCYDSNVVRTPKRKWIATCPKCGHKTPAHKRQKLACGRCYRAGKFSRTNISEYQLIYTPNV